MARFSAQTLGRHFRNHLKDMTCSVTIGATTATGSKGVDERARADFDAGYTGTYEMSVWISSSDFTSQPTLHATITVDSVSLRIGRVSVYPDVAGYRLDLVHPEQPDV